MRNRVEFENAVYGKVKSHEIRRRRNIAAISSTCAALVICVSLTTAWSLHKKDSNEAVGASFGDIQATVISKSDAETKDENVMGSMPDSEAIIDSTPNSTDITGESEEEYKGERSDAEPPEMSPESHEVVKLLIGDDLYVFGGDKLSDVMSILKEAAPSSDGITVTLLSAGAEQYTLSSDNIAKLLNIIND